MQCTMLHFVFPPSRKLRALCSMRRSAADVGMSISFSFEIWRFYRQEVHKFTSDTIDKSSWKVLRNVIHTIAGHASVSQPPLDEFASKVFFSNMIDRPHEQ